LGPADVVTWLWFAHIDGGDSVPEGSAAPFARATVTDRDGRPAGIFATWSADQRPGVRAYKIDARAVDPRGAAGRVSLVVTPPQVRLLFDDLAVQQARRTVLSGLRRRLVSTLVRGDSIFAGALTALPDAEPDGIVEDPFARIFPAKQLHVTAGFLGAMPPPSGPVIERYGSGNPWPWDVFEY
jgi:hypothetical protein